MRRPVCLLAALLVVGPCGPLLGQGKSPTTPPDGVYAVLRESVKEKDVLPLKAGEVLLVHRHRYEKAGEKERPRFLTVRSAPDVKLDLAAGPKTVKDGDDGVRILFKLRPAAAKALRRLTTDRLGKQVAVVVGGEVVTMHKIRGVIADGDVQITSCVPGAAKYLLDQLQSQHKGK